MFQRKQSLLLLLAFASMLGSLFVDLASADGLSLNAFHLKGGEENNYLPTFGGYMAALAIGLTFGALLSFKDRKKQMILTNIAMLASWAFVAFEVYLINVHQLEFSLWLILPFEAGFLCLMAKRLIKKDDDLVKSVDRIR